MMNYLGQLIFVLNTTENASSQFSSIRILGNMHMKRAEVQIVEKKKKISGELLSVCLKYHENS